MKRNVKPPPLDILEIENESRQLRSQITPCDSSTSSQKPLGNTYKVEKRKH